MTLFSPRIAFSFAILAAAGLSHAASAAELQESCQNCHGKDGVSTANDVPIIAGMSSAFIAEMLKTYKDASRYCPETTLRAGDKKDSKTSMCLVAKDLSPDDIAKLAAYFSGKKFARPVQSPNLTLAAKGKEIHETYCEKCHSEGGSVAADDASLLAGQWMPYLNQQFKDFAASKRQPNKKMKVKLDQLQTSDFDALVNYYGSFK